MKMTDIGVYEIESSEDIQPGDTNIDTRSRVYNNKRYQTSVKGFIFCTQLFIICGVLQYIT